MTGKSMMMIMMMVAMLLLLLLLLLLIMVMMVVIMMCHRAARLCLVDPIVNFLDDGRLNPNRHERKGRQTARYRTRRGGRSYGVSQSGHSRVSQRWRR